MSNARLCSLCGRHVDQCKCFESRIAPRKGVIASLIVLAVLCLAAAAVITAEQRRTVPLASEADRALAQLLIARDGSVVTFRSVARDHVRICVEQVRPDDGERVCFTVGDVRAGRVKVSR